MSVFLIRVVLRGEPPAEDYEMLHEMMERYGCERTILGKKGIEFHLPDAEYYLASPVSALQVRDDVVAIARQINRSPKVLVTEAKQFAWLLKPVDEDS